jgi:hypothetical protein
MLPLRSGQSIFPANRWQDVALFSLPLPLPEDIRQKAYTVNKEEVMKRRTVLTINNNHPKSNIQQGGTL